ncbi:MAG: F0F1 ATP synthase subunit epsilon [Alphaproteobacteria bacterium]|nr:F0F1 ATP synthase subunit epsilon [Alphaproteobacteria bacterium]
MARPDKVAFELVSPERLLVSEAVDMVVVPGTDGDFGVLPGHSPLLSTVRPGVIDVYQGREVRQRIFVAGGFAEVTPGRCTVLAEEAMPLSEIDRGAVETSLRDAQSDFQDAKSDGERAHAERRAGLAQAKLDALKRNPVH